MVLFVSLTGVLDTPARQSQIYLALLSTYSYLCISHTLFNHQTMSENIIPPESETTVHAATDGIAEYDESDIVTLDWREHIRRRPGMYIGKLGDGSNFDDGIYVLLKEVLDNAIDEFMMGFGKQVHVTVDASGVSVRDFGRGIPL